MCLVLNIFIIIIFFYYVYHKQKQRRHMNNSDRYKHILFVFRKWELKRNQISLFIKNLS